MLGAAAGSTIRVRGRDGSAVDVLRASKKDVEGVVEQRRQRLAMRRLVVKIPNIRKCREWWESVEKGHVDTFKGVPRACCFGVHESGGTYIRPLKESAYSSSSPWGTEANHLWSANRDEV